MKKLLLLLPLLLVLAIPARSQAIQFTASVPHTNGTPSGAPSTQGSRIRFDKTNSLLYRWTGSAWTTALSGALASGSVTNTELASGTGGIYKGSGTVPASTVATATNGFRMNSGASGAILIGDYATAGLGGSLNVQSSGTILGAGTYQFRAQADDTYTQMTSPGYTVRLEPTSGYTAIQSTATNGYKFWDLRATPRGVEYSFDYSATYNDRSLMDFGSVKALISDSIATVSGGGGGASYLVYTALLSQSGTDAPTATVLENTLGGTVVWTRSDAGDYVGTLSAAFSSGKTWLSGAPIDDGDALNLFPLYFRRVDANTVSIRTLSGGSGSDDQLISTSIEIRVYP